MGMPDDHEVRFRIDGRERRGIVFRSHPRRVVARFAEAAVEQDDLQVGALAFQAGERRRGRVGDPPHPHLAPPPPPPPPPPGPPPPPPPRVPRGAGRPSTPGPPPDVRVPRRRGAPPRWSWRL